MGPGRIATRLCFSHFLIALAAIVLGGASLYYAVAKTEPARAGEELAIRLRLVEGQVTGFLLRRDTVGLQHFCRTLADQPGCRLTVIAHDGTVLADSAEAPERMENHADRPEVLAAIAGRSETVLRFSQIVQTRMIYRAALLPALPEIGPVVLRVGMPADRAERSIQALIGNALDIALPILLLAAFGGWLVARQVAGPLVALQQGAKRFAQGSFDGRFDETGPEELRALARSMNQMAGVFSERLQLMARQHSQLEAVFASMVEGVITVDIEERIIGINQAGARLLQVDPEKVRGRRMLMAVRNSALERFVTLALTSSEPVEGEIDLSERKGRGRCFYAHGTRLHDSSGTISGALIVINDIGKLRKLETVRRDFVANVSHELKTPITSIRGFAETLLDGALDDPQDARRFVEIIAKQSGRLHAIIEDLLVLSRLEREEEEAEIVLREEKVADILRAAIETCCGKAAQKTIELVLSADEALSAPVNAALLEQAVTNLVVNAIKYSEPGSRVLVRADRDGERLRIEVEDFGVGIGAEHLPRLFERFYRSDAARSRKLGGTGLGLAIVKHIMEVHHGEVRVQSEVGRGTTFSLFLPGSSRRREE